MANARQVNLIFFRKWQEGFISFTCWIQVFCSNKIQSMDLLHNILSSLCFNNYFVVMILNNGIMIWIKNIFKKSFFCQKRSSTWRKNLRSIYFQWKKQKNIYKCNKFLTKVAIYKVFFTFVVCKKKKKQTIGHSWLISLFLTCTPFPLSQNCLPVEIQNFG